MASVDFRLDGVAVSVDDQPMSLLVALREVLGLRSLKDGCSPQGQCGCCTVLVDGTPRVACVTPLQRVRDRAITTVDGLADSNEWAQAFCDTGASQCGFCTPGIIVRLSALTPEQRADPARIDQALLAHLCRCTGWQTIHEACAVVAEHEGSDPRRDLRAAARRARLEGGIEQKVSPDVALGRGGFADDLAPNDALVAVSAPDGTWKVGESLAEAQAFAGKVQGRRTTAPLTWPVEPPIGNWDRTMQTTWTEPAYLEPDATWCEPGGVPACALGNGGAFGGKVDSPVGEVARRLADEHGRTVRVLLTREDTVRLGPKRPPLAIGLRSNGSGVARLVRPAKSGDADRLVAAVRSVAPDVAIEFADVLGPAVGSSLRGAVWAEVAAAVSSLGPGPDRIVAPNGARASATIASDGTVAVTVSCGAVLDEVVLRSYCIGAAHMALGVVRSEALTVNADGSVLDLTMRSFGILRAVDTPAIEVEIRDIDASDEAGEVDESGEVALAEPVNGSDAVFAAVLAAAWRRAGHPARLPTRVTVGV